MNELHPDTKDHLTSVLTDLQFRLAQLIGVEEADAALEAALGEFCRDHLDCPTDEQGNVVLSVPKDVH